MCHGTMDSECVGLERTDGVPSTAWKTRKHSIDSGTGLGAVKSMLCGVVLAC